MRDPCVYIMAQRRNGALYVGVTSDLVRRVWEHKGGTLPGFTATYELRRLVWFEQHGTMLEAIRREKAIKGWLRAWKIALIEAGNPEWMDLAYGILG